MSWPGSPLSPLHNRTLSSSSAASTPRSVTPSSINESSFELERVVQGTTETGRSMLQQGQGRSAIWKYFRKIEDSNGEGSICLVHKETPSGICGVRKSKHSGQCVMWVVTEQIICQNYSVTMMI